MKVGNEVEDADWGRLDDMPPPPQQIVNLRGCRLTNMEGDTFIFDGCCGVKMTLEGLQFVRKAD